MQQLYDRAVSTMAFDFSGSGESPGKITETNLHKRVEEAAFAMNVINIDEPYFVLGSSMGGYIAIKLLERFSVHTLVLFAPALYDTAAYNVNFGERFSSLIRMPDSWLHTDALALLDAFHGNLLLYIGEDDDVIPPEVITAIDTRSQHTKYKKIIRLPGCNHKIDSWLQGHPEYVSNIIDDIAQCLGK